MQKIPPGTFALWKTALTLATGLFLLAFCQRSLAVPAPEIAAQSWILLDATTGQTLSEHNADLRVEPASLTKIMTEHLVFQAIEAKQLPLDHRPPVSMAAYRMPGSRMFVDLHKPASVEELLNGMIVQSGNDASVILAEAISGSESAFAKEMNKEAEHLGLRNSQFQNATGLPDPGHFSTARDLGILTTTLIRAHPSFYPLHSKREYTYNAIRQFNRNSLLGVDPSVDGVKTGHTDSAKFCLIASAKRELNGINRRLISVVMGAASSASRAIESQKLLNFGFQKFETILLYKKNAVVSSYPVWKGTSPQVSAIASQDIMTSIPIGDRSQLKAEIERVQPLIAPISEGQPIGKLRIRLNNQEMGEFPLLAQTAVMQSGWIGRMWDSLRMMFNSGTAQPTLATDPLL